jgi:hypothetical protein
VAPTIESFYDHKALRASSWQTRTEREINNVSSKRGTVSVCASIHRYFHLDINRSVSSGRATIE